MNGEMDWSLFFRKELEPVQAYRPGLREEQIRQIAKADTIYKLSSNESPLPPFPSALKAMREALSTLNEYPDGSSHHLTQLLSWHYQIPSEQIIVGNGSNELIDLIAQTCLEPGDNVVYGWPSFVVYRSSAQIAGADCREVALAADGSFDLDALLAAIDQRTKIVTVCTPNNPTGAVVSAAALEDFLKKVPSHVLVVLDAAYEEFVDDEQAAAPLAYFDGQRPYVVLRTFSKIYALAGLRCGYGFAPSILVEMLHKIREPFNVNALAQIAARACLEDDEELDRRRALNTAGKRNLCACFERLGLKYYPSEANFVWVEVPDAAATFDALLSKGIITRPFPEANGLRVGIGDTAGVTATITAFETLFPTQ
ncbi:MAG: histidinol-phosphate transaminase [Coriobacteriales bacterium]|jgi:histidinol-phosphate aminotransferase|nr:histidinol-phosphate transaminase [Coriobacteriales bacterium]